MRSEKLQGWRRMILLLLPCLLLPAACRSGSVPQQAAGTMTPRPTLTSTSAPKPLPTVPNIAGVPVHFSTQDHVQLAGWLYGKSGTTAIICSHEHPGSKAQWSDSAPWFAAHDYLVLAYDFRGWGESQGQFDASKLDTDVLAAITFVQSQGARRVILLGASMGADISLIAASETQVAGVIALSPEYLFGLSDTQIRAISAPKLFINSEEDGYVDDTRQMFQQARIPKALHLYPGAAHGVAIFESEYGQDLIGRILAFTTLYAPPDGRTSRSPL
jgi:pimeloyl-ACP methyl ester carboxylesterase